MTGKPPNMGRAPETTKDWAARVLGTDHEGAGSRLGDLRAALFQLEHARYHLEAVKADLADAKAFGAIPIRRCKSCARLAVLSGYVCGSCGHDGTRDDEGNEH